MKKDRTAMLLYILQAILEKFPKYNFVQCESWMTSDTKTLGIRIEVTMGDEESSN